MRLGGGTRERRANYGRTGDFPGVWDLASPLRLIVDVRIAAWGRIGTCAEVKDIHWQRHVVAVYVSCVRASEDVHVVAGATRAASRAHACAET